MKTDQAQVLAKVFLTEDTIKLTLGVAKEFKFIPGQFVLFEMNKGQETKNRAYSILEGSLGKISFLIKLIKGGFSSEILRKLKKGDTLDFKGPFGHLVFNSHDQNKEIWFITAGCGLAPFYGMIKDNLAKCPNKKFVLLFSAKIRKGLLFEQEFRELAAVYPNFKYIPSLTQEKWAGKMGRVQKHLPKNLASKTFYICGIKELVQETKELLLSKGVNEQNIKSERYL